MRAVVVWTTVPDARFARKIARALVEKKLAACVSFREGFESVYRWKKKIECVSETLLIIKTSKEKLGLLEKAVRAAHPYEVPEFLAVEASGSKKYLSWIQGSLK